ncbi:HNH endonuclease [Pseudoalteromonas luteoviolacea]|uniref:HNH nuclease domain-containing protein n=1 Tax=Pseudoalteromonas luteoviolacea S4054 TaxID=1129367 RepID=A0A0F6AEL3_9GAMM|nr:HNH endonuclease [Pseudoalteromonas luteoviolacea]AOT08317.1 hypothetical protein S4054249_10875 [Pseudoalteromonas luteoviolacea]AOT13233.1 hypothetical protein S40542_10850 [Pseudoalteromonas luteoviolacea]AOT18146.1 hypothetical protein S4054_10850 [Pseudoalteromonas luteoviolacea]KKE84256.1 hypothetical protein N479_10175 [Pseudoalteromonas luteoviolacea S4054]KZN76139.1 hypothetical protein N481_07240 [Pseudoalteromonas luteoviolacea S4047-1]
MFIEEIEFNLLSKKYNIHWRPIKDNEITTGKRYIISDKQFELRGQNINVLEVIKGKYRRVSTRQVSKNSPYLSFDVSSSHRSSKQKSMLLHRARLISFVGEDPNKTIARHGSHGQYNHDLDNLTWGTHAENMHDAKEHGVHKGDNNASAKITNEQALAIYILSQLELITPEVINALPIGKGAVSNIKAKRKWEHVVTGDIEKLVDLCKEVQSERMKSELNKQKEELEKQQKKEVKGINNNLKSRLQQLISEI